MYTEAMRVKQDLARLQWVWNSLTPKERQNWANLARTTADPEWDLHRLFLACKSAKDD